MLTCTHFRLLSLLRARADPAQGQLWDEVLAAGQVWQRRFYDFVVWSHAKRLEKLRYIHRNPVKRGLVLEPEQWPWSSFRHYAYDEAGAVLVDEQQPAELKFRNRERNGGSRETILPTRKKQEWGSLAASPHSHPCIKRKGGQPQTERPTGKRWASPPRFIPANELASAQGRGVSFF